MGRDVHQKIVYRHNKVEFEYEGEVEFTPKKWRSRNSNGSDGAGLTEDIIVALRRGAPSGGVRFHGRGKLRAETKLSPSRSALYYSEFSDRRNFTFSDGQSAIGA